MSVDIDSLAAGLELVYEAAAITERGRVVYMNPAASALTGGSMTGEAESRLFPAHVTNCQAASFVTGAVVAGARCSLRASTIGGDRIYIFTPEEDVTAPGLFAAIPALRRELLNMKLASDRLVSMAAASGDEKFSSYSAALSHSYYQIKRLVQNISVLEGLARGDLPFCPAAVDISGLCRGIVSAVEPYAARAGVELRFDCSGPTDTSADSELIELMVLNLLSNSLTHTPSGGRVELSVNEFPGGVMLAVNDTGCGIDPEVMKSIFSRYRQTLTLSDMAEGPGLGLAIARGIAEKHGGALIIESRIGSGACVRASISRSAPGPGRFRAPEAAYAPRGMDLILTQLSNWLPPECCAYDYD